jgi:GNAT superfamily N-acetyltransferase
MAGPENHWFKAVDYESGELVGYVGMLAPKKTRPVPRSVDEFIATTPANADRELLAALVSKVEEVGEWWMGRGMFIGVFCLARTAVRYFRSANASAAVVASTAVHADYQGQGIAKRLFLRGLKVADKAEEDVYLGSAPGAMGLYQRVGFELLKEFTVRDTFPITAMLREPVLKDGAVKSAES